MIQTMLKGKFGGGGPYPLADLDRGIQIRGGSKSNFSLWISASNFKCLFYNYARERPEICNVGLLDNYTQKSHQRTI